MQMTLAKVKALLRNEGPLETLRRCALYPFRGRRDARLAELQRTGSRADVFIGIFEGNYWNVHESVSGGGSTLRYTASLRNALPELFRSKSIESVYDAPCGDFNWMRHVVRETGIDYLGADIVPALIDELEKTRADARTRFIVSDIVTGAFPEADLWICRDCLFHLSYADIQQALANFVASKIPYVLTSTHRVPDGYRNEDIRSGGFRQIDLFSAPFCFPADVAFRVTDWVEGSHYPRREMCVWTREQIAAVLPKMARELSGATAL